MAGLFGAGMISSAVAGVWRGCSRMLTWVCAAGAALVVAGCGGASGAIEPFKPERLMVLGDDGGAIVTKKYRIYQDDPPRQA